LDRHGTIKPSNADLLQQLRGAKSSEDSIEANINSLNASALPVYSSVNLLTIGHWYYTNWVDEGMVVP
jgi:hypothetical protein